MITIEVGLGERSYPIVIGADTLSIVGRELARLKVGKRYGIIADQTVADLYGNSLIQSLEVAGISSELLTFPAGEASKNLSTIANLAGRLADLGFDRKDALIGFGGGVTGDLAGFLASSYMRGISFVQVPTTLLAQVDSSVGGKTGVDIPQGKNLVGAFYQPKAVFIDIRVLRTLPKQELLGGLAEVIKYGVIRDSGFFHYLKENRSRILGLEDECIVETVKRCCEIKADVVEEDEREGDIRRILNYGHTIGHAVEGASDYTIIHGFAVAIGMVAAARLAEMNGLLSAGKRKTIIDVLADYELPVEVPENLDRNRVKQYLLADKKTVGGRVFYVLPTDIGSTRITDMVTAEQLDAVLSGKDCRY